MKIILCGAGLVGREIAHRLAAEGHDVTVIDQSPDLLREVSETLDVRTIVGHSAHPDILEKAGARDSELLIAVTRLDEVNMVTCEVAHALFNVPRKIARVRHKSYTHPEWSALFQSDKVSVDVVISPESEVSQAVLRRLSVPGAFSTIDLIGGELRFVGVAVEEDCPVVNTTLSQLRDLFPGLRASVCARTRGGTLALVGPDDQVEAGDDAYFVADARDVNRMLAIFGHEEKEARRIVIAGAGDIGLNVATVLEAEHRRLKVTIIEQDRARAIAAADRLEHCIVLNGNPLDAVLLNEAGVRQSETFLAVTDDDKTNILSCVIAKHEGSGRTICLYNDRVYGTVMRDMGIDAYLSPRVVTVSTVLRNIRRGHIHALHAIHDGEVEIIEGEVLAGSVLDGQNTQELSLQEGMSISAVWRNGGFLFVQDDITIAPQDRVIIIASAARVRDVEALFQKTDASGV